MPVNYVGRTTYYSGRRLMDLLCNLKNFGVGRIVYRQHTLDSYEESSYFIIKEVEPDMIYPSAKSKDKETRTKVIAHSVFRGEEKGDVRLNAHWKPDWKLVPKAEEHLFRNQPLTPLATKEVPESVPFPPLLSRFLMDQMKKEGYLQPEKPRLKLKIKRGKNNKAVLVEIDAS